jgi:threonine synthase
MITLATAHPAKFPAAVEKASGQYPDLPDRMADLYEREERLSRIANDLVAIEDHIRKNIA